MVGAAHPSKNRASKAGVAVINSNVEMENILNIENLDFKEALHMLLHQEKVARNEKDMEANERVLGEILNLCVQHRQWKALGECIVFIVAKLSCIHASAQKFIQETIKSLEKIPDKDVRCDLIKTLRTVCDGKLYLEREHAEVTQLLANLYEADGKCTDAAEVLSDLKIEAYGLLTPREKVEFILGQMRLLIKCEQKDKAAILAKKIQLKFFSDAENEDLKIQYYEMKIEMERWTAYLETARYYLILSSCESLSEEIRAKMIVNSAIFCALSPKGSEQIAFTEVLLKDPGLKKEETVCELLKLLSSKELISVRALEKPFKDALKQTNVMDLNTRFGKECLKILNNRIIEHNILTIANYYSRIYLVRMAELIETTVHHCEENISRLVNSGLMNARIDRFTGIVDFSVICIRECVLNSWSDTVGRVMDSTNKASHHVQKEFSLIVSEVIDTEFD